MFLRTLSALAVVAVPAAAQTASPIPEDVRAIHEALLLPEVLEVISQEGEEHGEDLAGTLFGTGPVPADWTGVVAAIYDPDHLESEILDTLARTLEGEDTAEILAFFESEPGRSLTALELAAREAMVDDEVEQEAKEAAAVAMAEASPRLDLLRRYAEASDLIEMNVAGTMNTNLAYFTGLLDGGGLEGDVTESEVLADVWAQEPRIRADTEEWVYSFLLLAYEPASDADIEALIAFSESEAGRALNRAVFEAFDQRFEEISRALGLAAARYLTTDEA
jgi:hypothetical protein